MTDRVSDTRTNFTKRPRSGSSVTGANIPATAHSVTGPIALRRKSTHSNHYYRISPLAQDSPGQPSTPADTDSDPSSRRHRVTVRVVVGRSQASSLAAAADPLMQRAFRTACSQFAASGNEEVGATLVDLLVDLAAEPKDSYCAICINEALSVVFKLRPQHRAILTCVLILRMTRFNTYTQIRKSHFKWRAIEIVVFCALFCS